MTIDRQHRWHLRAHPPHAAGRMCLVVALSTLVLAPPAWGTIFTDIAGLPAQRAIERLAAKGIFRAGTDGRFNPTGAVSRVDLSVLLARVQGLTGQGVPVPAYKDLAAVPKEALPAVAAVTNLATVAPEKAEVRRGPLVYTLTADKRVYAPDEIIEFRLTVENTGKEDVTFEFGTNKHFDYFIRDGAGHEVARWSYGKTFLPKPDAVVLAAGKTVPYDPARWRQLDQNDRPVPPGRYELVAVQETKAEPTTLSLIVHKGVMQAYPDNTFRPKQHVTRAELAAVIVRVLGLGESAAPPPVSDAAEIPAVLRGEVATAIAQGIVPVNAGGSFQPQQPAARADAAQALDVLMDTQRRYNFHRGLLRHAVGGSPPQVELEDEQQAFRVYRVARHHAAYRNDRPAELSDLRPGDTLLFLNVGDVGDIVYIEATGP
jgi:hypothetical protein